MLPNPREDRAAMPRKAHKLKCRTIMARLSETFFFWQPGGPRATVIASSGNFPAGTWQPRCFTLHSFEIALSSRLTAAGTPRNDALP